MQREKSKRKVDDMALTIQHARRQRLKLQHQAMKAAKDKEIAKVITRAVKRYGPKGTKRRGGVVLMEASPEKQINALDQYVNDLRIVGEEMELRYPDVSRRRLWRIDQEIDNAVEAIARLKIEQVAPGK